MNHPLHKKVGEILKKLDNQKYEVILDPACGGNQNIPLFLTKRKANDTEICNVDGLVMNRKIDEVIAIIEIEESNITPVHLCGKFLVSALAKYFIHENKNNKPYLLKDILFIHILKSFNNDKTKKKKQIENIKKNIWKKLLSCNLSNLTTSEYEVIWSDNKDLEREILEKIEDI